jgi:RNA polymerase-binding transcription factor DksA
LEAAVKEKLQAQLNETLAEIKHLRESLKYELDTESEEGDPDLYEREKTLALIKNLERKVESIEYALQLEEKGIYGICQNCSGKIDPARLQAIPHTTLCINCQAKLERATKRG